MNDNNRKIAVLVILRVMIGWHLLYEGVVKLSNPDWSAITFLSGSIGFLSALMDGLRANPLLVQLIDQLNIWLLILLGTTLIAGLKTKIVSLAAAILLTIYYLSQPPFFGLSQPFASDGNYLIVNKNLIEIAALFVIYIFPGSKDFGLDHLISVYMKRGDNGKD